MIGIDVIDMHRPLTPALKAHTELLLLVNKLLRGIKQRYELLIQPS